MLEHRFRSTEVVLVIPYIVDEEIGRTDCRAIDADCSDRVRTRRTGLCLAVGEVETTVTEYSYILLAVNGLAGVVGTNPVRVDRGL